MPCVPLKTYGLLLEVAFQLAFDFVALATGSVCLHQQAVGRRLQSDSPR